MASVTFERVRKAYEGGAEVVKEMDLHIEDGELVTLVGPSGCGKSTTLNLIAGLETPTSGTIRIDGEVVNDRSPKERGVAMVFQSYALYPHMTVRDNIAFPLRIAKVDRAAIDSRVRDIAARLGLEAFLERKPKDLSGGQRQRVALGRALVRRPRLCLFDEPLSNLDAALRARMRAEIKRLHAELGATFVYVTHDQAEAMTLSDRVVILNRGVVQQQAPPRELYARPDNLFVAAFIGSPRINLVPPAVLHLSDDRGKGAHAVAGIRPEDVSVSAAPTAGAAAGKVYVVEPMGAETWVTLEVDGERLTGRAGPDYDGRAEDTAYFTCNPHKVLLFDATTEQRI
jgi:multiple sugar transport system ATP-binding protein